MLRGNNIKVIRACILFLINFQNAEAQNLIPDSSFESNKFIPSDFSQINASNSWRMPSQGTTDLFCKCNKKKLKKYSLVDVPQNPMGYQDPHSGNCYAGFFVFSHGDYREYIQTPLNHALEKDKWYLFTMYISLADYSRTSLDQLGVCFTDKKVGYNSSDVITDLNPVDIKIDKEVGRDVKQWHRVSVKYKSQGGESFLLIGSFKIHTIKKTRFKVPKEIKSRINQNSERDSYYYIDDVSLVETTSPEPHDKSEPKVFETSPPDSLLVCKNVLFQTNETVLLSSSFFELDVIAEHLKKNPQTQIEIIGHTDNSGNEKINRRLSTERAKAVADYLASKNIDRSRITYKGWGSLKAIAPNDTEEGKKQNRRVEFILSKK